jgi:c-di-GMP-binding flagellar brake protein YcgR
VVVASPQRELIVALAGAREIPPALLPGSEVIATFATTAGLLQSRTSVLRVSQASQVTVALARLAAVETIQRRQFFRISASLSVRLTLLGPPGAEPSPPSADPQAVTVDISAGGVRADTTLALAEGDRVGITVQTPRGLRGTLPAEMSCEGQVVRAQNVHRRHKELLCVGIKFLFEAERERERWVQLTFTLQRSPV